MSKRIMFFVLTAVFVLMTGVAFIVGPGWCQKPPSGTSPRTAHGLSPAGEENAPVATSARAHDLVSGFGRVPVYFVPNRGQADSRVNFYVQGDDKTVYFSPDGLTLAMRYTTRPGSSNEPKRWTLKLDFLGARGDVMPEGIEKTGASISYFKGKPDQWKTGLPAFSRIIYRELWPGIDLAYKGEMDKLKYEFIVHPGADPSKIKLAYRGTDTVTVTEEGRLEVKTPAGVFEDEIPVAYQEVNGKRVGISASYSLEDITEGQGSGVVSDSGITPAAGPESRTHVYGFAVGEYDRSRTLVLDPAVLVYCGYIGGANEDGGSDIAVDGSGNIYVSGRAYSDASTFPVAVGPDLTPNTGTDAYVAKVNASGTGLIYCGYLASSSPWEDRGIAVDADGNAYVTGFTSSNESSFPVKVGPDLTYNGGIDAFIAKVNASGTELVYCGYIGGSGDDTCQEVAVDSSGHAYVSGNTYSSQATFPVKVGPDLTYNGDMDAFVAKINASGTGFDYCGYIGGSGGELASGIAIDSAGSIYVSGHTSSSAATFPVKVGPSLIYTGGGYVAKVAASGTELVYCGYIKGTWWTTIAVDNSGSAYVTGSSNSDLPVLGGPDLTFNGGIDAFIAKVDPAGTGLVYCGYIGGAGDDAGSDVVVDVSGNAYVTGGTVSTEATFPVVNGPDLTHNGGYDGFIAKIDASGATLVDCGYIGGADSDGCGGIAVDGQGNVYVCGGTSSSQGTFPVIGGPDLTYNGGGDAFIAKVGDIPGPPITSVLPDSADAGDPGFLLSVYGSDFVDGAVVRWGGSARPTEFISSSELQATIDGSDLAAGKIVQITVRNPNGGVSNSLPFTIDNPLPSLTSISTTQVTGGGAAFSLTVLGSNFVPNSIVRWNGSDRVTTYVSATELQAAVTAADIASGGEAQITVFNPSPEGGVSGAVALRVSSFTLSASTASITVTAGQSATYTIQLTPQYGSFDSAVSFSCVGAPSKCTATFSPTSLTPGAAAATTTLTLTTAASSSAGSSAGSLVGATGFGPPFAGLFTMAVILLLTRTARKPMTGRLSRRRLAACALVVLAVLVIGSCSAGGGGDDNTYTGTPKGTHTISVQATSGNMTVPTSVTLVVN